MPTLPPAFAAVIIAFRPIFSKRVFLNALVLLIEAILAPGRLLLVQLVERFVSEGPVVVGIDYTIERRWGAKIKARGIYRDPVRSSRGHFVKASGLRWLSLMLLAPVSWAGRAVGPGAQLDRARVGPAVF